MATQPQFINTYRNQRFNFTSAYDTRPRVVLAPGTNGSRIHGITATTSDTANNTVVMYEAQPVTLQSAMTVGSFATNNTITRTGGNFITDGWVVGERLFVAPTDPSSSLQTTTAANGQLVTISTVASGTLTVTGTPFTGTPEAIPADFGLWRVTQLAVFSVPLNSGHASGVPAVSLLQPATLPSLDESPNRFLTLGANNFLAFSVGTVLGAGELMGIKIDLGDY